MAKCERKEIPQPKYEYVLTLTEREALALAEIGYSWINGPVDGPCGAMQDISNSLRNEGVLARGGTYFNFDGANQKIRGKSEWPEEDDNA